MEFADGKLCRKVKYAEKSYKFIHSTKHKQQMKLIVDKFWIKTSFPPCAYVYTCTVMSFMGAVQ